MLRRCRLSCCNTCVFLWLWDSVGLLQFMLRFSMLVDFFSLMNLPRFVFFVLVLSVFFRSRLLLLQGRPGIAAAAECCDRRRMFRWKWPLTEKTEKRFPKQKNGEKVRKMVKMAIERVDELISFSVFSYLLF